MIIPKTLSRLINLSFFSVLIVSAIVIIKYPVLDNDFDHILLFSAIISVPITALSGSLCYKQMNDFGSGTVMKLLVIIVLFIIFSCTFFVIIISANTELGEDPIESHQVRIVKIDKRHIVLQAWNYDGEEVISSSPKFPKCGWKVISEGDLVVVDTRLGTFGFERIVDIRKNGQSIFDC